MDMTFEQFHEAVAHIPFHQIAEVEKEQLVFSDEVRKMCESNSCGQYGRTWMCPPGVGEVAAWKERMLGYAHAFLFSYVGELEDSFDFESMIRIKDEFGQIIRQIKGLLAEAGAQFLIFGAGGCQLCEECAYPDAPCRRPEEATPSVEACGLFIAEMAKPCGFNYINGPNTVTHFGLVMAN